MPQFKTFAWAAIAVFALMALPACGGSGGGPDFAGEDDTPLLEIQTTVLPALSSGEDVDVQIVVSGGCGGPYLVQVTSGGVNGGMPPGIGLENREFPTDGPDGIPGTPDDGTGWGAFITGVLLSDGTFNFTVKVTDTGPGCESPFREHSMAYTWVIGVGAVRIVGADPDLVPMDDPNLQLPKWVNNGHPNAADPSYLEHPSYLGDIDAFPTTIYGQFTALDLTVAGGTPPYEVVAVDDPADIGLDPDATKVPDGVIVPPDSTSLVGTPSGKLPDGGKPYLMTFRAEDFTGLLSQLRKIQWKIDTPPILIATTTIPDVYAGANQNAVIQIGDGVPPFIFELIAVPGPEEFEDHAYAAERATNPPGYPGGAGFPDQPSNFPQFPILGKVLPTDPDPAPFVNPSQWDGINVGGNPDDPGMADRRLYTPGAADFPGFGRRWTVPSADSGAYGFPMINDNSLTTAPPHGAMNTYYPESFVPPAGRPHYPYPSEGTYLIDDGASAGTLSGVPRRVGEFAIFVHVYSQLVPKAFGQHGFKNYVYNVMDANDDPLRGVFRMDPSFTVENAILPAPFASIPEAQFSVPYNPDNAPDGLNGNIHSPGGLQCNALSGVAFDGKTDGPHSTQVDDDPSETVGQFLWSADHLGNDPGNPSGADVSDPTVDFIQDTLGVGEHGVFTVLPVGAENNLTRRGFRQVDFTVEDLQLPKIGTQALPGPDNRRNWQTTPFRFSIGPDKVIITENGPTDYGTTVGSSTGTGSFPMSNLEMRIMKFQVAGGAPNINRLDASDLSGKGVNQHVIPADAVAGLTDNKALGELLSGKTPEGDPDLGLVRIGVNPVGWWNQLFNIDYYGPRAGKGVDPNRSVSYYHYGYSNSGGYQPNSACVELPMQNVLATAVDTPTQDYDLSAGPGVPGPSIAGGHDPDAGIYADGGRLYCFDSENRMGFFIIRKDASIYVPFATTKTKWKSFGDNMMLGRASGENQTQFSMQIAISPDGRFAAAELSETPAGSGQSTSQMSNSGIVVFSLCGEKLWGGATYAIVDDTALAGMGLTQTTGSNGLFLFASSMAATDEFLYFLVGCWTDTSSSSSFAHTAWRDHYICRLRWDLVGGPDIAPGSGTNWTQTTSIPMQTPFHRYMNNPTSSSGGFVGGSFGSVTITNNDQYMYDASNWLENDMAPMPFRASADGESMALLAGPRNTSTSSFSVSGSDVMRHFAWVDENGTGFNQVIDPDGADDISPSDVNDYFRCPMGGSRGIALGRGPNSTRQWSYYSGPTSCFEISSDGERLAFVYYGTSGSKSSSSTSNWRSEPQDIVAYTKGADWNNSSRDDVTDKFAGPAPYWRFGGLTFTTDNDGLVFWGGYGTRSPGSSSYTYSMHLTGTFYTWNFSTDTLRSIFDRAEGGSPDGTNTYSGSSLVDLGTATNAAEAGYLRPMGSFIAKGRDFLYVATHSGIGTGSTTGGTYRDTDKRTSMILMGINISTADQTSGNVNGYTNGEGFIVDSHPSQRGFSPVYYYQPRYALDLRYFAPTNGSVGFGRQALASYTGEVFFGGHFQPNSGNPSTSFGPDTATTWRDFGYTGGVVYGFKAEVAGPIVELTDSSFGSSTTATRGIMYIEAADMGDRVSFIYQNGGNAFDDDGVGYVKDIRFLPDGLAHPDFDPEEDSTQILEPDNRVSEGLVHDSTGRIVYFAYKGGSGGNENDKRLVEQVRQSDGTWDPAPIESGQQSWFSVLWSGR